MKKLSKILLSLFLFIIVTGSSFKVLETTRTIETNFNDNLLAINEKVSSTRTLNNIVVFIEFNDSDTNVINHLDDKECVENANTIYNSDELFEMDTINGIIKVPSMKKYFERESYGKLSIITKIFPKIDGKVVSYKDSHPIAYYLKYSDKNKVGYKNQTEALEREKELLDNAVGFISSQVEAELTSSQIDTDNNGDIDAIAFIIEGQKNLAENISWGDLLWSHESANRGISSTIHGKKVNVYNLIYASDYTESASLFSLNRGTYGTLMHEFGHTLGFSDLYRYGEAEINLGPVSFYDIMGNSPKSNPSGFLTYFVSEYDSKTNWHNPIPEINKSTNNITLKKPEYSDPSEQRAIKLKIDGYTNEYFIIEYHEKKNTYENYSADESGIIIYRVNENNKYMGNATVGLNGEKDHIFIFRPGETSLGAAKGSLTQATLNMNRKTYGKKLDINNPTFDNETIYFSNGTNSGITIEVTNQTSQTITFNVTYSQMEGSGSKENPYLISDAKTFIYLMSLDTQNKYYKLTSDLDFKDITDYPEIDFKGNLDGNNKTMKNIKTNGSGVFSNVGNFLSQTNTRIENLKIENLNVYSKGQSHLGGFADSATKVILNNIHLLSGSVIYEGEPLYSYPSVGGFIGTANNDILITNCSTNLQVSARKNVGGFIGINLNATIKNSFASGTVSGESNIGGFIGVQAITDNYYNTPEKVYYNISNNKNLQSVGGIDPSHNLNTLPENMVSNGIGNIYIPNSIDVLLNSKTPLDITITPNSNLNYNVKIDDQNIAKYENGKIIALKVGTTNITTEITIGSQAMKINSKLTVKNIDGPLTETEVLNILGLTKKNGYVVGFELNTKLIDIKKSVENINGVTLKNFTNGDGNTISDGIVGTGMSFTLNINGVDHNYKIVIKGDVNGDGLIYATDYVKVKNHIMGKSSLTGSYLIAADINNDGNIYATDYVLIKNHIMGKSAITQN